MDGHKRNAEFDDPMAKRNKPSNDNPSTVIHIRGLPLDVNEGEVGGLAAPFGIIAKVFILKGKGQAFVQMGDISSAMGLVQYYQSNAGSVRDKTCYFQFSSRQELVVPSENGGVGASSGAPRIQGPDTPSNVVLVTITNVMFPITVDVLHSVFSRSGQIMRIVIFQKNANLQALIQFGDLNSAVSARTTLDGQNIYTGCCALRIQYSNLTQVTVKRNDEKSWDYSTGADSSAMGFSMGGGVLGNPGGGGGGMPSMLGGVQNMFGGMGGMDFGAAAGGMGGMGGMSQMSQGGGGGSSGGAGCVLLVNKLNPERTTADAVYTLFSVYGRVVRVKILYNKRDTALVQFSTAEHAEAARMYLNDQVFMNSTIAVHSSKHTSVSMPSANDSSELTKDFTNEKTHRFTNNQPPRAAGFLTPPSATLHVANIPCTVQEGQLRDLFIPYGVVLASKFLPRKEGTKGDRQMALVQLSNAEQAIEALVHLHFAPLLDSQLRVSFTKSTV